MIIIEDTRQQRGKHISKKMQMAKLGVDIKIFKLPVGDYVIANDDLLELIKKDPKKVKKDDLLPYITVSVDTKQDLDEINGNVTVQHERFRNELVKASDNGIKLYILCEGEPHVDSLEDVYFWQNKHDNGSKHCTTGPKLYKSLKTIQDEYGAEFVFCQKKDVGRKIIELLGGEIDGP